MPRLFARLFCVFAAVVVLVSMVVRPAEAAGGTDPTGVYHGFFQSSATPGRWGLVEFAIGEVHNRRWTGTVTMILPVGASEVRLPFAVDGTIAADVRDARDAGTFMHELGHDLALGHGSATFNGVGHGVFNSFVEFHGRIDFLDGGAALTDARYRFRPPVIPDLPPDPIDEGTSTLVKDYIIGPDQPANVAARWDGVYHSDAGGGDGVFLLDIKQSCMAPPPTEDAASTRGAGFIGTEIIDGNTSNPFYFRGSIGSGGQFVVAGWDLMGDRFLVTGNYASPRDPQKPAEASAMYLLLFANGMVDRGSLNFAQQLFPPDPCRVQIIEVP